MIGIILTVLLLLFLGFALWAQRRGPFLQYLFFCRSPIWIGVALVGLAPIAIFGAPSLLANLFELSPWGIVLVSWLAVLVGWVVMITAAMILRYAPLRFGVPPADLPGWLRRFRVPLFAALALPVIATAIAKSPPRFLANLGGAFLGIGLAALSLFASAAVREMMVAPGSPPAFLLLPSQPRIFAALPRLGRRRPARRAAMKRGQGYVDPGDGRVRPGHLLASFYFAATALFYLLGFLLLRPDRGSMPSLGYLLLIMILAGWGLAGVTFWLDRFRVPVFLLLMAASFVSSELSDTDHYYRTYPRRAVALPAPPPSQAFVAAEGESARKSEAPERPIVVVAASGGGITASLWTACVLTSLQKEAGADFARSIRLISSVSGGSVGTLFYLDRFTPRGPPEPRDLDRIVVAAGEPSLDAIAWGLAYPDLWRIVSGFLLRDKTLDRGWALERVWRRQLAHPDARLEDWRAGVEAGWLPAAVLNSTVVETGEQLLFTPLAPTPAWSTLRFSAAYPGRDVPLTTAARMSATFPWVSPVAQALVPAAGNSRQLHLGDGGYYDNFGVVTAVNWMRSLNPEQRQEMQRRGALVVLIRAFPDDQEAQPQVTAGGRKGWLYGLAGPLVALEKVRVSTQRFRNGLDLDLLRETLKSSGVPLTVAIFELRRESPLSWKLTPSERAAILAGWNEEENRQALAEVRKLFPAIPPA